tara:strand:+ start:2091 stop:2318 length:228 start_codon:yes stop_codon:yes gene_type:complete
MEEQIYQAMINSYKVIIEGIEPSIIIESNKGYFIHHPSDEVEIETLEVLLEFFEREEEYDKCIKLKKFIENYDKV